MPNKNYDKETIVAKLIKNGLKPKPSRYDLRYWEVKKDKPIGIKLWGYIDFLGLAVCRTLK